MIDREAETQVECPLCESCFQCGGTHEMVCKACVIPHAMPCAWCDACGLCSGTRLVPPRLRAHWLVNARSMRT